MSKRILLPYYYLLKPRVMLLVVFTGIVGLWLSPGHLSFGKALIAIACIAGGSGGAAVLNMWYERDIDALMERTRSRPLPQGQVRPWAAFLFGLILSSLSVGLMYAGTNTTAAFYLAIAILFYVGVYTIWLKRRTPQNIVIGGAAGAFPPLIGWAAGTGETTWVPWVLSGIIFLWTPPHFWALALHQQDDYKTAGIPMLPVVAGEEATKTQILLYIFILVALTLIFAVVSDLGLTYMIVACLLGVGFIALGLKLKYRPSPKEGLRLFLFSIVYLFVLFLSMMIEG